jgi:hypothetical protein
MTAFQSEEQSRREKLLMQWAELRQRMSGNAAANLLRESPATLLRWKRAFVAKGRDGLVPDQAERCGRKPLAVLTDAHRAHVQKLVVQTDPNTKVKISTSMALRLFAHSDKCPEDVAAVILKPRRSKHTLTPTLKRQAKVTPESKDLYRGDKTFSLNGFSQPRSLTWIDADGAERPILAGDIFEADDMTLNQPWYVEWQPDPAEAGLESGRAAERFGVRTLRGQLLVMIDVGSQRILGFLLLARLKDSYRAEDIWSWFGQIFRDVGLPRVGIRLEQGIWKSKEIHGLPVIDHTWTGERRIGGLSELGVRVIPSYSPKTKSIENLFNNLQKVLGCTGVQVGRQRGEFEKATKDYLACRTGRKHPADCGFLHADELVKRITNACMFLNGDCREGEVYKGIPDELWQREVADLGTSGESAHQQIGSQRDVTNAVSTLGEGQRSLGDDLRKPIVPSPHSLRQLDPAKSWIFMREKRPLTIRNGMVRAKYDEHECSYYFTNPELFATLGRGYRVIVCFDPAMPEQGAVIFNREAGARDHTDAGAGEFLGIAELVDRVPQYSALDNFDDDLGYERRRRFTAQCRKTYRAIPLPGRRGAAATTVRDIRGNEARVETNTLQAAGCGSRANPASLEVQTSHVSPAPATSLGRRQSIPASDFDEEAELARIARLEREATARGDLIT